MNDIVTVADHASQQNDRWLFTVMFILVVIALIVVWRWIISDRNALASRLTEMTDRHIASVETMTEVVANNTAALKQVIEATAFCKQRNH